MIAKAKAKAARWWGHVSEDQARAPALHTLAAVAAMGLILCLSACGEGVHTPPGAVNCDPLADTGCDGALHCRLVAEGDTRCLPHTARIDGTLACAPGTCDPGAACVLVEGALGCHPVCRIGDDSACGSDGRCAYRVGDAAAEFGVCAPRCTLSENTCGVDTTCAPSAELGFAVCVAVGTAGYESPCSADLRCAKDLACLLDESGTRCRLLCDPIRDPDPCVVGQCTGRVRPVPEVGFCVGDGA